MRVNNIILKCFHMYLYLRYKETLTTLKYIYKLKKSLYLYAIMNLLFYSMWDISIT